jgi:DNA gyrase subunit A
MLMSTGGTVIKVPVEDVKRLGRATQGVIVMRTREGEEVSTLAPVVEQASPDESPEDEAPAQATPAGTNGASAEAAE